MKKRIYISSEDGVTHINVYSKGKTELGRLLTNFAETPFVHKDFGNFKSVEGLWYFLKTGQMYEELKEMNGKQAKSFGRKKMPRIKEEISEEFKENILEGIRSKLRQNKYILKMLIESDLPLSHYYVIGSIVKPLPEYDWILEEIERIRKVCKKNIKMI